MVALGIGIVITLLVLLDLAAVLGGFDTRDGNDWVTHRRVGRG